MRKFKIYYRLVNELTLFSTMKMERNIEAHSCGEACDELRKLLERDEIHVKVLEVFEQVFVDEETIVLPEDL